MLKYLFNQFQQAVFIKKFEVSMTKFKHGVCSKNDKISFFHCLKAEFKKTKKGYV